MLEYKIVKEKINALLAEYRLDEAWNEIMVYESQVEYDLDSVVLKAYYYFLKGEIKTAEKLLLNESFRFRFNFDIYFNLGFIYQQKRDYEKAWYYYNKALALSKTNEQSQLVTEATNIIMNEVKKEKNNQRVQGKIRKFREIINEIKKEEQLINRSFPFAEENSLIGKFFDNYLIGIYDRFKVQRDKMVFPNNSPFYHNIELFPIGSRDLTEGEYVVPVLSKKIDSKVTIVDNDQKQSYKLKHLNRYYYFRMKANMQISGDDEVIIAKPIALTKKKGLKDLVLTIFVDGLSQTMLDEYGTKELMPNTYQFFRDGIMCKNTYVSGEWTYVSLASFFTGEYTTTHRMFHPDRNSTLSRESLILSEGFKENGYVTAKIDGDWRSTPSCGYHRGFDRIVYEIARGGVDMSEVVDELMEHMETFKETNQFIWTCLPDLHDIADGYELPISIQSQELWDEKPSHAQYDKGETSVRQSYNEGKKRRYIRQLKRVDRYLGILYQYIEQNFDMDEVTIALVSDHGQGYLVPEGSHALSKERVKVPLMVRSKEVSKGETTELIQGLDLMSILYNLGNVQVDTSKLETNLPVAFGGEKKRDHTYSEMIFPGTPYKVSIHMKDATFYYETIEVVQEDGRVNMEKYTAKLIDNTSGDEIYNEEYVKELVNKVNDHMKYNRIYE